jgi:mRNA-degrading endonuclease toxin of MazEF toxin-antitoxin module
MGRFLSCRPLHAVHKIPDTPAPAGTLYPSVPPSLTNGLTKTSYALVDQLRSVDPQRISRVAGRIDAAVLMSIDAKLRAFLALP